LKDEKIKKCLMEEGKKQSAKFLKWSFGVMQLLG